MSCSFCNKFDFTAVAVKDDNIHNVGGGSRFTDSEWDNDVYKLFKFCPLCGEPICYNENSNMSNIKDFTGYHVWSSSPCCQSLNGKIIEKTIRKAFPYDDKSTLYTVKVKGVRAYQQLYEDEMHT